MSSTNRSNAGRIALDGYYTPQRVADACLSTLRWTCERPMLRDVIEPSVGGGSFARTLVQLGCFVTGIDVNPNALGFEECSASIVGSWLEHQIACRPDWVIGNPPFDDAEVHVSKAIEEATEGAAFLLRLAFLESDKRVAFWRKYPASRVYVLTERVPFEEVWPDGSIRPMRKRDKQGNIVYKKDGIPRLAGVDSCAYGFFVWDKRHTGPTELHHLSWKSG